MLNRELSGNLKRIEERMPLPQHLTSMFKDMDYFDFLKSNFVLKEKQLGDRDIYELSKGLYSNRAKQEDYALRDVVKKVYIEFANFKSMKLSIDKKMLVRLYSLLKNQKESDVSLRKYSHRITPIDFEPCDPNVVQERLTKFFSELETIDFDGDIIEKAVFVFDQMIKIAPFEDEILNLAYCLMTYVLLKNNFYLIPASSEMLFSIIKESLKLESLTPIYELFVKNAIAKSENIIRLIDTEKLK